MGQIVERLIGQNKPTPKFFIETFINYVGQILGIDDLAADPFFDTLRPDAPINSIMRNAERLRSEYEALVDTLDYYCRERIIASHPDFSLDQTEMNGTIESVVEIMSNYQSSGLIRHTLQVDDDHVRSMLNLAYEKTCNHLLKKSNTRSR